MSKVSAPEMNHRMPYSIRHPLKTQAGSWIEKRFLMMLGYVLGYMVLFWGYYVYLVPVWGYYGFLWRPDWGKAMEALCYVGIISWVLPPTVRRPSDFFLHMQFLLPILPMLVLFGAMGQPRGFTYTVLFSFFILFLTVKVVRFRLLRAPKIKLETFQIILLFGGYLVITSIILQGGVRYFNLNFARVYEYRAAAALNLPWFYGYLNPWVSKVVFPFSFLLAILTKKRTMMALSLVGSVLMFGLTSHKGAFFYPFAVLLFWWIAGRRRGLFFVLVGYGLSVIVSLIDYWFGIFGGWVATLLLRRIIFVPALLNFIYYDFFSQHGFVYWAQSKITFGVVPYRFDLDVPHLIGYHYFGNPSTGANTGWIGSGFANAGVWGIFIYALIVGMILALLDAYCRFHDKRVIIAIFVAPMLAVLMSSDLPTALLTHGTLIGLIFLLLFQTSLIEEYSDHQGPKR